MAGRFKINPRETAMENLFRAATYSVAWYYPRMGWNRRTVGQDWDDLFGDAVAETVRNFLVSKVRGKKYRREFPFFQNVLSSTWATYNMVTARHERGRKAVTGEDIEEMIGRMPESSRPVYNCTSKFDRRPTENPGYEKAVAVREAYEDMRDDAEAMGLRVMGFQEFVTASGARKDPETMYYLAEGPDRRIMREQLARDLKDGKPVPDGMEFLVALALGKRKKK
jgi:hypothetical protein